MMGRLDGGKETRPLCSLMHFFCRNKFSMPLTEGLKPCENQHLAPFSLDMSWLERCPGKKWVGWSTWPSTGVDPFRNASVEIFSFGDRSLWILLGVSWRGWQWDDVVTFTKFMQAMRHGHGWLARDMEFMRIGHQWPGEAGPWFGILLIMRFLNFFIEPEILGKQLTCYVGYESKLKPFTFLVSNLSRTQVLLDFLSHQQSHATGFDINAII